MNDAFNQKEEERLQQEEKGERHSQDGHSKPMNNGEHKGMQMDHSAHDKHDQSQGHTAHVDHSGHEQMFRQKFWVSLVLSDPGAFIQPIHPDLVRFQHAVVHRQPMDYSGICGDCFPLWWGALPANGCS